MPELLQAAEEFLEFMVGEGALPVGQAGVDGKQVVFADEYHRQFLDDGEIGAFMENAFLDRRVAEKNHRHGV